MALYYLDPRQAGTGAAPDVTTWRYRDHGRTFYGYTIIRSNHPPKGVQAVTETAALRVAREAAGFGHVAEMPCAKYTPWRPCTDAKCEKHRVNRGRFGECIECAWPRDAHRVQHFAS